MAEIPVVKAFLMHRDRDFDPDRELPPGAPDLMADLDLDVLFTAMAVGDPFLLQVAHTAMLSPLTDPAAILYRQHILRDCVANRAIVAGCMT